VYESHHQWTSSRSDRRVQSKLERVTRHFDQVIDIAVILTVDNLKEKTKRQKAEINLRLSGKTVYVESLSQDLYAAIDTLIDKLDRQVMKYKGKVQQHGHDAIKHLPDNFEPAAAAS
jgi:putative sigma-54 modulation protein